eukprot:gene26195-11925_t
MGWRCGKHAAARPSQLALAVQLSGTYQTTQLGDGGQYDLRGGGAGPSVGSPGFTSKIFSVIESSMCCGAFSESEIGKYQPASRSFGLETERPLASADLPGASGLETGALDTSPMTSSTPNIGSDDLDDTDEHPMISEGGAGTSLQHSASNNSHHTASQGGSTHGVSRTRTLQMLSETFKLRKKKPPTQVGSPPKSSTSQLASASSLPNTNAPFSGDVLLSSPPLNITQSPSKSSSMRRKDTGSNLGGPAQGQPVAAISSPHSRSASESLDDLAFGGPPGRREGSYGGGLAPGSFLSLDDGMSPPPPEGEGAAPEGRKGEEAAPVHQRLAPVHDFNPTSRPNNPLSKVLVPFRMMKPLVPKSASKAIAKPAAPWAADKPYGTLIASPEAPGVVMIYKGIKLKGKYGTAIASPEAPGVVMIYEGIKLKGKLGN